MSKSSSIEDIHRTMQLIRHLHHGKRVYRRDLAALLEITPRAVSHLIVRARERFGVVIASADDGTGYFLADPGVFDMARMERFLRLRKVPVYVRL